MMPTEMETNVSQIQNYLKNWEKFRDLWEVKTDIFVRKYENLKPSASSFDRDMGR
jgi:dynein heavy chain